MQTLTGHGPCRSNGEGPMEDQETAASATQAGALAAYDTTRATVHNTFVGSSRARRALSALLYLAAGGAIIAAVAELPEHVAHAGLLLLAAIACWVVGEATS